MKRKTVVAFLLLALVASIDFMLPLGVATGVLYLGVILVGLGFERAVHVLWLGLAATVLIAVGWIVSPAGNEVWIAELNRLFSIGAVWITSGAFFHFIRSKQRWHTTEKYSIFDGMMEGIQVIDSAWRYHYLNDSAVSQAGMPGEALLGHTMMEKYPGIEKTKLFENIRKCMYQRECLFLSTEFEFPNGASRHFELRLYPVPEGVLITSIDVTRQRRLEQTLRQWKDRLELAVVERTKELANALKRERKVNQLRSDFISRASHELKSPLAALRISLHVLEQLNGPEHTGKREEHLDHAQSTLDGMLKTMRGLFSLERLEQGEVYAESREFDLQAFIAEEVEEIRTACKEGQHIRYHHRGGDKVRMDKQILRSILSNLLSNAVKYSDADIELFTRVEDERVLLQVSDKGIGIPEEEQKNMFSKFFRASNTGGIEGTGLGLIIVRKYVELLRGTLQYWSMEGVGTTFQVTFTNAGKPVMDSTDVHPEALE